MFVSVKFPSELELAANVVKRQRVDVLLPRSGLGTC